MARKKKVITINVDVDQSLAIRRLTRSLIGRTRPGQAFKNKKKAYDRRANKNINCND